MSRRRTHPVYVARALGDGCGHQHSTEQQAIHCGQTILRRRKFIGSVDVYEINYNAVRDSLRQLNISRVVRDQPTHSTSKEQ
jgi:hypothetical protein